MLQWRMKYAVLVALVASSAIVASLDGVWGWVCVWGW
jgi:Flp pilus assembly pilin Flp